MEAYILKPGADVLSRNIDDYPDGIIIPIDKPYRWTSADVIRKVKYAAIRHFGKKNLKVGHAGTLDPLATGVLLVCIGKATKLAETLQSHDKEYVAGITFGATTPSYDLEKEIDRFFPYEHISAKGVAEALPAFIGEQDQVAPLFSAKSVDGVRAYELARKLYRQGAASELDEAANELIRVARINISELELVGFDKGRREGGWKNNPSHSFGAGPDHSCCRRLLAAKVHRTVCVIAPDPCGQGGSTVLKTATLQIASELGDDTIFDDQISIMHTLHTIHLFTLELPHISRQNSRQRANIIYYSFHTAVIIYSHNCVHCCIYHAFSGGNDMKETCHPRLGGVSRRETGVSGISLPPENII